MVHGILDRKVFFANQVIFREGDPADRAYLIQEGLVEIRKQLEGTYEDRRVAQVHPGELFGEMAMIDDQPRMASAVAVEKTVCVVVPLDKFHEKMAHADPFLAALLRMFTKHIRTLQVKINRT